MNPMPELIPMLKELRLSGILDSLEIRNKQAIDEKLSFTDSLAVLPALWNAKLIPLGSTAREKILFFAHFAAQR